MSLILEALCIDLVDILGAGRPGRKPATLGNDLESADRGAVTWSRGQFGCDRLAGEAIGGNRGRL